MNKPTKSEFEKARVNSSTQEILQICVPYKRSIQSSIIFSLTPSEISDIRECKLNQGLIDKLCQLGAWQLEATDSVIKLYACAMAIGTIIKEYEWGTYYISQDGLYELACRILDKKSIKK